MKILSDLDITSLIKASKKFNEVLAYEKTEIVRDASIQRFEVTYELVCKTLRKILIKRGIEANSPTTVFRLAFKDGIISDVDTWFAFIDYRNNTTHVYNEAIAEEIYSNLPKFQQLTNSLISKISSPEFK